MYNLFLMLDLVVHKLIIWLRGSRLLTMSRIMQEDCTESQVPQGHVQLQKKKK